MNNDQLKRDVYWKFWPRKNTMRLFPLLIAIGSFLVLSIIIFKSWQNDNALFQLLPNEVVGLAIIIGFSIFLPFILHNELKYYSDTQLIRMTRHNIRGREKVIAIYFRLIEAMETTFRNNSIIYHKREERKVSKTAPFITLLSIQPDNIDTKVILTKYFYEVAVKTSSEQEIQYFNNFLKNLIEEIVIRFTKENNLELFKGRS